MEWDGRMYPGMYYCILFVAAEAYNLAESADSIAIPIHCVASGTRSTACLRPDLLYHTHLSTLMPDSKIRSIVPPEYDCEGEAAWHD